MKQGTDIIVAYWVLVGTLVWIVAVLAKKVWREREAQPTARREEE
jgi:hypothetical protein